MAVEIGALRALLSLDSAAFEKGAKRAVASMGKMQAKMHQTSVRMGRLGRNLSAAITAPLAVASAAMVKSTGKMAVEINRFAQISGATTSEFQRMAVGAERFGIEQEKLSDILKDVNDRVGDFVSTGGGPMADFFENIAPKVGVTAEQFAKLSGPQALQLYVDSLEKAGVNQQEMTFYLEAMASDLTALAPLLANNGRLMNQLADQAQATGAIMDQQTIQSLVRADEALQRATEGLRGMRNQLMAALAPALEAIAEGIAGAVRWFNSLSDQMKQAIAITAGVAASLGPVLLALSGIGLVLSTISAPLLLVVGTLGALAAGVGYVVAQFGGFENALEAVSLVAKGAFQAMSGHAIETFADMIDSAFDFANKVADVVNGVQAGFRAGFNGLVGIVGGAMAKVANTVIDKIENMLNRAVDGFNNFASNLPDWMRPEGGGIAKVSLGRVDFGGSGPSQSVSDAFAGAMGQSQIGAGVTDAMRKVGGDLSGGAKKTWRELRILREDADATGASIESFTDTIVNAGKGVDVLTDSLGGGGSGVGGGGVSGAAKGASVAVDGLADSLENTKLETLAGQLDGVADALLKGKEGIKDFARTALAEFAKFQAMQGLRSLFGAPLKTSGGGILGSIFGGFRADGGPVAPGKAYMVGERGPEMFMPKSAGTIIPNGQATAQALHVTVGVDQQSGNLKAFVQNQAGKIVAQSTPQIVEAVGDRARQDGAFIGAY